MNLDDDDRDNILKNIKVLSQKPFKAMIVVGEGGHCSLLNDRGLCSVQLKYGHDFLSRTCRIYPRKTFLLVADTERYLELSCEVAVKLILFDQNIMRFEEAIVELGEEETIIYSHKLEAGKYTSAKSPAVVFWKLRTTSTAIIQSRQYKVRLRMLILCLFMQELDGLLAGGRDNEIIRLAEDYLQRLDAGYFNSLYEQLPDGAAMEPSVGLDVLREMEKKNDRMFNKYVAQALEGLGIDPVEREIPERFNEDYKRYYDLYFSDKEYIFENYIVHNILSDGFPFNYKHETSVMKNYAELLAKYDLLEFLLTGVCRHNMKFDKRRVVECVTFFARNYDHRLKEFFSRE
jgi:lysine-N-methylase